MDNIFWNQRYLDQNTPWDLGMVSPPLKYFLDKIEDLNTRILIPGAGRAYEAVYLHQKGFREVWVCDWANGAFGFLNKNAPGFPSEKLLCQDFFTIAIEFDIILEQTFFCAIDPSLRERYAQKTSEMLVPGGTLAGVLFASHFQKEGPPFGGTAEEYRQIFSPYFEIEKMGPSENSVAPRAGNELWVQLRNKAKTS